MPEKAVNIDVIGVWPGCRVGGVEGVNKSWPALLIVRRLALMGWISDQISSRVAISCAQRHGNLASEIGCRADQTTVEF